MKNIIYRIAEIDLQLDVPKYLEEHVLLPSFISFKALSLQHTVPDVQVSLVIKPEPIITVERKLLSNLSPVWYDRFTFEESEEFYITTIKNIDKQHNALVMHSTNDFKQSTIYADESTVREEGVLSWLLMMVFGQVALNYNTVMIHASVVENDQYAYAFLGKSGTGKSTHSRLWLQHIPGMKLLNDDNPAIRLQANNEVYIYGTPWSGKTSCYVNKKLKLKGLVRLEQAKENKWLTISGAHKMIHLLPSCSAIRWNKVIFNQMLRITESIVSVTPFGLLQNLPNKEAAELCYEKINY